MWLIMDSGRHAWLVTRGIYLRLFATVILTKARVSSGQTVTRLLLPWEV